jgi:hypothetical protein
MDICIIDSLTRYCINRVIVDDPNDFVPYRPGIEVAPRHDGQIGWKLTENNEWEEPPRNVYTPAQKIRRNRDYLLKKSDKYSYPDYPMTNEQRTAWIEYRQALRDITAQSGFPDNVVWPVKPE